MSNVKRQFTVIQDSERRVTPGLSVAFATDDNRMVNQHFGSAKAFAIYEVSVEYSQLLTMAEFGNLGELDNEDKLVDKFDLLQGCVAVYCRACGSSAVRQLLDRHVQPLKVDEDSPIKTLVASLQRELKEGPSNWLANAIRRQHCGDDYCDAEIEFLRE